MVCTMAWVCVCYYPSEESQLTHLELKLKLVVRSFRWHSVTSRWTHKMTHTVSFLWVCNSHCELAVCYLWDHPVSSPCISSSKLTVSWSLMSSPCSLWSHCLPHGEIFRLSSCTVAMVLAHAFYGLPSVPIKYLFRHLSIHHLLNYFA